MKEPKTAGNHVLVFDWGDTVMKVLPQYNGPMARWPEVKEVDGIVEALEELHNRHTIVLATNASDSTAEEVWKALKRVGLAEYFTAVFTANELGARKPDVGFFRQIESVLTCPAHQLIMIGDSYGVDMLGAKQVGWRAAWYNPTFQSAAALLPLHDTEIDDMRRLPAAINSSWLPDYPTSLAWMLERSTPNNILMHVQLAASVGYQLAVWLRASGEQIDPVLVHRGGILHDIAKIDSIKQKKERGDVGDHAAMGRELLFERGQPDLALIADRHMPYQLPDDPRRPRTWEQKLVHFADKMAEGSGLVGIEERVAALKGRYPQFAGELEASLPVLLELQDEICQKLRLTPDELIRKLQGALGLQVAA